MTYDNTPWAVGGGAVHSPEVARLLAYVATGGAEGIVGPTDLKVMPTAVPSARIRSLPGAAAIQQRSTSNKLEMYTALNRTEDVVDIAPTTSAGGRTDLIVAQVEDPFLAGASWQKPADPTIAQYVFTRVIPNVPAGTTRLQDVAGYEGRTAITLARVTIPASTGTITAGMITDLRKMSQPRTSRYYNVAVGTGGTLSTQAQAQWPTNVLQIDIPEWATHFVGKVGLNQLEQTGGNVYVKVAVALGPDGDAITSADTYIDNDLPSGTGRIGATVLIGDAIPVRFRGTRQRLQIISTRQNVGTDPGVVTAKAGTQIEWDLQFSERPS
jgi:hypothetical protein